MKDDFICLWSELPRVERVAFAAVSATVKCPAWVRTLLKDIATEVIQASKGGWRTYLFSSLSIPRVLEIMHQSFKVIPSCLHTHFLWIRYTQTYKVMMTAIKNYQKRSPH